MIRNDNQLQHSKRDRVLARAIEEAFRSRLAKLLAAQHGDRQAHLDQRGRSRLPVLRAVPIGTRNTLHQARRAGVAHASVTRVTDATRMLDFGTNYNGHVSVTMTARKYLRALWRDSETWQREAPRWYCR